MLFAFDQNDEFQFDRACRLAEGSGASYHLGVDGLAVLLIALTTLLS